MTMLTSNWWRAGFFMMWAMSHARQQELDPESDDDGLLDHFFNVWRIAEKHASTITVETDALAQMADDLSIPLDDVYTLGPEGFRVEFAPVEGAEIGERLGWSPELVSKHKQIKQFVCLHAWVLARCTTIDDSVQITAETFVQPDCTNVQWKESHFRAILKHLSHDDTRATMRAQVQAIRELTIAKKITAKLAGTIAQKYAWFVKLKRQMQRDFVSEVTLANRKALLKSINAGVFGKKITDDNQDKFNKALTPEGFRVEFAPVEGMARHLDESNGQASFQEQAKTLIADGVEFARLEELRAEYDELARQTRMDDVTRVAKQMRAYWNNEQCFD